MNARALAVTAAAVACAAVALALGACSGNSGSTTGPVPTPTPTGAFASVVNSARGTLMLSLGAVKTIDYYGRFLRPGLFPAFVKPNPIPVCDPKTATATTVATDFTGHAYSMAVAFYPPGDSKCARSIVSAIEMYFPSNAPPSATNPQLASGYAVAFGGSSTAYEYDVVHEGVYATSPLNVDAEIDRFDPNSVPPVFVRPGPGKFPATFPLNFPPPQSPPTTLQPLPFVNDYYASIGFGAGTSQIGTASTAITNPSFFQNNNQGVTQYLGAIDAATISLTPGGAGGELAYSAAHKSPSYAISPLAPIALTTSYLLGAGKTAWSFQPVQNGFVANNFGAAPIADSATTSPGGILLVDAQSYTDEVNKVGVQIQYPVKAGPFSVAVTDLLRGASATTPGPIGMLYVGQSVPYTYTFDGSPGFILDFTVVQ